MNIIKKKDVVKFEASLLIRSGGTTYIEDFLFISKMDNPKVILEYIKMTKKEIGILLKMDDIPDAPKLCFKPSRKRKVVTSEAQKETQKPPKKKASASFQKEVKEVIYTIVLIPTKTRSRATRKTPQKINSSYVKPTPPKKVRKMILHVEEVKEEAKEDNHSLVWKSKEVNKLSHELMKESIEEGENLITYALRDKALENPSEGKVLKE